MEISVDRWEQKRVAETFPATVVVEDLMKDGHRDLVVYRDGQQLLRRALNKHEVVRLKKNGLRAEGYGITADNCQVIIDHFRLDNNSPRRGRCRPGEHVNNAHRSRMPVRR